MIDNIAISVKNITKTYKLFDSHADRVKETFHPLRKKYHRPFNALTDVSFEVSKGETFGIIGRNGSGKSTLLQIICGILQPTSGSVEVNGRVSALLELGAGFNPEFTGRQNVYINGSILGLKHEEIENRFDEIAAFADIGKYIDQPVKTYSSGMSVRLAFAVMAYVDADILVIDEALAVGDAFFVQKCMRFLRNFMEHGTVLFVSHDISAVVNLCNKAMLLTQGVSRAQGAPKDMAAQYLQDLYEEQQGKSEIPTVAIIEKAGPEDDLNTPEDDYRDMRLDFFNTTTLRNDVELFKFNPAMPSFGKGAASIESVILTDKNDKPLSWVVGGEMVKLKIYCKIHEDIYNPIVGFQLKDRLGQLIFGDVTSFADQCKPLSVTRGQRVVATFEFRFPVMLTGDYSISPAIAEGTLNEHIQHHWLHDAIVLQVHASSVCFGLIQIPMKRITLRVQK